MDFKKKYEEIKKLNLSLDMSRGKPGGDVLSLSNELLSIDLQDEYKKSVDIRNYGALDGLSESKSFFAELLRLPEKNLFVGGNSSLFHMWNIFNVLHNFGINGSDAWAGEEVKVLCPVPGYDRHFSICEEFGISMIPVAINENGVDMDEVERLLKEDDSIKGIWVIPLYSNPTGCIYSEEVLKRLAEVAHNAKDFYIFYDNAYGIHHVWEENTLPNFWDICEQNACLDKLFYFFSTSKVTFPGGGIGLFACSDANLSDLKKHISMQTIGFDKVNQTRQLMFLKDPANTKKHMGEIAGILKPKFDLVISYLTDGLVADGLLNIDIPKGGYFISVYTLKANATDVINTCKELGVVLTPAGSTYPYKKDPEDSNIRIAPTYPTLDELKQSLEVFDFSVRYNSGH